MGVNGGPSRSEEHTSELQSPCNLACRLLLGKKTARVGTLGHRVRATSIPQIWGGATRLARAAPFPLAPRPRLVVATRDHLCLFFFFSEAAQRDLCPLPPTHSPAT